MNTQLRKYIFERKKALGKIHIFKTSSQLSMMHASIGYFYMWFMKSQIMFKKYQICLTVKYLFDLRIFILLIVATDIYQIGASLVLNHSRCLLRRNLIFHEWKAHFDHVNWYLATNYVECRLVRLRSSYTKSAIKRWTAEWTIESSFIKVFRTFPFRLICLWNVQRKQTSSTFHSCAHFKRNENFPVVCMRLRLNQLTRFCENF